MDIRLVYFLAGLGLFQCELVELKCDSIKKFVEGHNKKRLELAQGKVPGQPAASKMNALVWDEELAAKAAKWASRNKYAHNPDKKIRSGRFDVGENIFEHRTNARNYNLDLNTAISAWFDEYKYYSYKNMEWSDFSNDRPVVGHYTQMSWSDTRNVGCGISKYYRDGLNHIIVVCNYGPAGNIIGRTPYKKGEASNKLLCQGKDCNQMYGDRC